MFLKFLNVLFEGWLLLRTAFSDSFHSLHQLPPFLMISRSSLCLFSRYAIFLQFSYFLCICRSSYSSLTRNTVKECFLCYIHVQFSYGIFNPPLFSFSDGYLNFFFIFKEITCLIYKLKFAVFRALFLE